MNKTEFLKKLEAGLGSLPQEERLEQLTFYSEMIDDRMEEGLSEEEAVAAVGPVEQILSQIAPPAAPSQEDRRKLSLLVVLLLIFGCPVWLSIAASVFSVVLSVYVTVWSVIISLWAVFASLIACAVGFAVGSIASFCTGAFQTGAILTAMCLVSAGLSIFLFFGCRALTNGTVVLTKRIFTGIKNRITGKEKAA